MSRAGPLVILAVGAFGVGIAVGALERQDSETAQSFADAWERQDFEAMHAELSPAAKEEYSVEELTQPLRRRPGDGHGDRGRHG